METHHAHAVPPPFHRVDQAMLATVWVSIRYGMWGDVVGCTTGVCLAWVSMGAFFSCGVVRVYRYHNVLVKHSGVMLPVTVQVKEYAVDYPYPAIGVQTNSRIAHSLGNFKIQ